MNALDLLPLDAATCFDLDAGGHIRAVNSPEGLIPPRLHLARCSSGSVLRLRHDVPDAIARECERLASAEPALGETAAHPIRLDRYVHALATQSPVDRTETGLVWLIPGDIDYSHPAPLIRSGTPQGDRLLARFDAEGMPPALVALGFVDTREFWAPWCVALEGNEVASIAFAARLRPEAAEIGVATVPAFRGRGFAAAATAGWAAHPALRRHTLFYSTSREHRSSQRVVERLGLRFLGITLSIY